jgi:hypothetical protein
MALSNDTLILFPNCPDGTGTQDLKTAPETLFFAVLGIRIRIRRMRMLLGLPDPNSDPLVTSTFPDPDPSIIKQKNIDFYCFVPIIS